VDFFFDPDDLPPQSAADTVEPDASDKVEANASPSSYARPQKFTADMIRTIRSEAHYMSRRALAKKYGCSASAITQIVHRNSWRHVT
jgi:hypothetical protein